LTITTVPDSGQVVGDWQITSDGKDGFGSGEGTFSGRFRFETSGVRKWKFSGSWTDKDGKTSTYFKGETESPEFKIFEVKIISAEVTQDKIHIELKPDGLSGNLKLELVGPSTTHTIREVVRNSGSYDETFGINDLAEGEYTQVRASWKINNQTASDVFDYHIKVLGNFKQTWYNVPIQSGTKCQQGMDIKVCVAYPKCKWNIDTWKLEFIKAIQMEGTGKSISYGYVKKGFGDCKNRTICKGMHFYSVDKVIGACNEELSANTDIAVNYASLKDLPCGTKVYIHAFRKVKFVKDFCQGCGSTKIDNFYGESDCNTFPENIESTKVIKIY